MLALLRSLALAGLAFFTTRCELAVELLVSRHRIGILELGERVVAEPRGPWALGAALATVV